jgi:hypothetical protein
VTKRRLIKAHNHPLATKDGQVDEHRLLLYKSIGPGAHPCHFCQAPLEWRTGGDRRKAGALIVERLDRKEGWHLQNLVPSCWSCSLKRRKSDTTHEDETYIDPGWQAGRLRAVERVCENQECQVHQANPLTLIPRRGAGRICLGGSNLRCCVTAQKTSLFPAILGGSLLLQFIHGIGSFRKNWGW